MTNLYVAEFGGLVNTGAGDSALAGVFPPANTQVIAAPTTAVAGQLQATTKFVCVIPDAVCSIKVSPSASPAAATVADFRLAANVPFWFAVASIPPTVPGQFGSQPSVTYQISVIPNT